VGAQVRELGGVLPLPVKVPYPPAAGEVTDPEPLRRPLCDFASFAYLLDDQVVAVGLDDAFEFGVLVAGKDEEEPRLFAYPLVGREIDGELLGAAVVRALANEGRLGGRGAVGLLEPGNVLVHLAKQGFVTSSPLLPECHDQGEG
jgi:hypothetical protein